MFIVAILALCAYAIYTEYKINKIQKQMQRLNDHIAILVTKVFRPKKDDTCESDLGCCNGNCNDCGSR